MNLLAALENGLFALGQVLRFPVFALLWVCVATAGFMSGSCVVDAVVLVEIRPGAGCTAGPHAGTSHRAPAIARQD